jgi:ubiquitin-protein ligase
MSFCGTRQQLMYRGRLVDLPHDVLGLVSTAIIIHGGSEAAGRLRCTCKLFCLHGGHEALNKGCQAAIAALVGCSEGNAQLHRLPANEDWLRTAAIMSAGAYARDSELLALQTQRFVDLRRDIQESSASGEIPPLSALYRDRVNQLRAELAVMRSRHGDAAVARCIVKAEAREVAELPEGFHLNETIHPDRAGFGNSRETRRCGHLYLATVPGLSGTLHDNAVYPLLIFIDNSYPDPPDPDPDHHVHHYDRLHHKLFIVKMDGARFHPNMWETGRIGFNGMDCFRTCWDASCSMSELLLFTCASLHQMQNEGPHCEEPYLAARYDRPHFRRKVREMALTVQADPRLQPTPKELLRSILLPDPSSLLRPVRLPGRTYRLWWQREGKWPSYTYPDDVGADGKLKDPEGTHFGWL